MAVVRLKTQQGGIELVLRIQGCDDVDEKPLQLFDAEVLEADASSEEFGTKSITPEEMAQMEAKLGSILQGERTLDALIPRSNLPPLQLSSLLFANDETLLLLCSPRKGGCQTKARQT